MTGNDNPAAHTEPRPFWSYSRLWPAIVLAAALVLYVHEHQALLETVQQANQAVADTIERVTPSALIAGFNARAAECDYRYGVYCAPKPSRADCLRSDEACRFGPHDRGFGYLAVAWDTIRTLAQLPDTTWYMIKTAWNDGYVPFGLLILFILINVAVTTRVPILLWPISLPLSTAVASGLFWLVQHTFLLGTYAFGALLQLLLGLFLGTHFTPPFIVTCCKYIRAANELHDVAHKSAEVMGRTPHIRG